MQLMVSAMSLKTKLWRPQAGERASPRFGDTVLQPKLIHDTLTPVFKVMCKGETNEEWKNCIPSL